MNNLEQRTKAQEFAVTFTSEAIARIAARKRQPNESRSLEMSSDED